MGLTSGLCGCTQETLRHVGRQLQRLVRCCRCWWRGHEFSGLLGGEITCKCGTTFEYDAAIWEGVPKELKRWAVWKFGTCRDYRKTFGDHSDCIPF